LTDHAGYYKFQERLFGEIYKAQEYQAEVSRNMKRLAKGSSVPNPPVETWEVEQVVIDRVVRQLRAVGDALAWHVFNFDRRAIIALANNDQSGPMVGKVGLEYEKTKLAEIWTREGVFALMHDLTNCIRIGDVTKFGKDQTTVIEVKKNLKTGSSAQMARLRAVFASLMHGAPMPAGEETTALEKVLTQFKSHLGKSLGGAIAAADVAGSASIVIGSQWVVNCASVSGLLTEGVSLLPEEVAKPKAAAFVRANMSHSMHHLQVPRSVDQAGRAAWIAPFTVFPFSPEICARLTCDYLTYDAVIAYERLESAFQAEGFRVQCCLPPTHTLPPGAPEDTVMLARRKDRGIFLRQPTVIHILIELVDPRRFAVGVAELLAKVAVASGEGPSGIFTFSNERAVWR